jgi:hypothetical protein
MEEKKDVEKELREMGTETLTTIVTRLPNLVRKNE